ncbi:hypothetical protein DespoDRAFT_03340, partial [Desulfobacter postgatei 2ac9]
MMSVRTLSNFLIVLLTIHFKWSLIQCFLYDSMLNMLIIAPCCLMSKKRGNA